MNIFALDDNPRVAAQQHLDKHVVKMIIEYAQLLSTAHRVLDGLKVEVPKEVFGRSKTFYLLSNERLGFVGEDAKYKIIKPICYSASHMNHPCGVWTRESDSNYNWLYKLFEECSHEYTHRYGKIHKTYVDLKDFLREPPHNIAAGDRTAFPSAMGDEFKVHDDPIASYKNYYLGPKAAFARWTNRPAPDWFKTGTKDFNVSHFERTRQLA